MALFSIDNDIDFPGITSDHYVSRAGLCTTTSITVSQWKLVPCFEHPDGDSTPVPCNIYETMDQTALWVNQQTQLFSGAPDISKPEAQFIITADPSDPSYIEIESTAFTNTKIIAADFSNGSQSLVIVSKPFSTDLFFVFLK